jgi:hypothetical protein
LFIELRLKAQRLFGRSRVAYLTRRRTKEKAKEVRARKKRRAVGVMEGCILVGVYYFGSD